MQEQYQLNRNQKPFSNSERSTNEKALIWKKARRKIKKKEGRKEGMKERKKEGMNEGRKEGRKE